MVAWHGNMSHLLYLYARSSKPLAAKDRAEVQRPSALERASCASIGLDEYLCCFGKIGSYNARNRYFLDVPDVTRFGTSGVSVCPGYEHTKVSRYVHGDKADLRFIKVDWDTLERPALTPWSRVQLRDRPPRLTGA